MKRFFIFASEVIGLHFLFTFSAMFSAESYSYEAKSYNYLMYKA